MNYSVYRENNELIGYYYITATMTNYPMDSMENVKKLFNSNGFKIVSIDETEIIGESGNTIYFQVVAQREEEVLS